MNPDIARLEADLSYFQSKQDECSDIIKQLTGYDPQNLSLTISVEKQPIVTFAVGKRELNFTIGCFMSWHSYYGKCITDTGQLLEAMRAVPTESCVY